MNHSPRDAVPLYREPWLERESQAACPGEARRVKPPPKREEERTGRKTGHYEGDGKIVRGEFCSRPAATLWLASGGNDEAVGALANPESRAKSPRRDRT